MSRLRARTYDRSQLPPGAQARGCDHPGCHESGEYRAPRSRDALREYYWFCLEHVRGYNAAWDFFRGMGPDEIEQFRRADVVGGRPSWPLGARGPKGFHYELGHEQLHEALRRFFFDDAEPRPTRRPATAEEAALAVLNLDARATAAEIKARYKELVKAHHPDANGGDKAAEDRLKTINQAYTVLKNLRAPASRQAAE